MDSGKYKKILNEVFALMRGAKLEAALAETKSAVRIDAVQDLMREAIRRSSLSMFNGKAYFFGGTVYEELKWVVFENLIHDLLKKCNLPYGDHSRIEGIIKVCRRVVHTKVLVPDNAIMVFKNCVFDTATKTQHPFSRKWIQVSSVPYDYNPDDYPVMWSTFLDQVLPDRTMQMVLQEFLGSIFIDRTKTKIETMLILKGPGSNGKSVVFETVMGVLGRENVKNYGLGQLISGSERLHNVVQINGKRLNYCSEIQALEIGRDSDALKALISGEPVEARTLYQEGFTVYNIPLLMANANIMPYLKDWSHGMRRRICIIPFEQVIPPSRQRKGLAHDLAEEYPAIFNWILQGRDRFINNGYKLTECAELEAVLDEYQSESNTVIRYMLFRDFRSEFSNVTDAEPIWRASSSLHRSYLRWCDDNEISNPENSVKFGRILTEAGYKKRRTANGIEYAVYGRRTATSIGYANKKHKRYWLRKRDYEELDYFEGRPAARNIIGLSYHLRQRGFDVSGYKIRQYLIDGTIEPHMYGKRGCTTFFFMEDLEALFIKLKAFKR